MSASQFIEVGKISGFFGVKGWVKLYSYTRPREGIQHYTQCYLGNEKTAINFTKIKKSGKNVIAHIKDVDSREEAEKYLGLALFITQKELPKLDNEYYWHELLGLTVINQDGQELGNIAEMLETGANDVMVIKPDEGEEILIPYAVSHFVLSVDLDKQQMVVDWDINTMDDD